MKLIVIALYYQILQNIKQNNKKNIRILAVIITVLSGILCISNNVSAQEEISFVKPGSSKKMNSKMSMETKKMKAGNVEVLKPSGKYDNESRFLLKAYLPST